MKLPILENAILYVNQDFLRNRDPQPAHVDQKWTSEGLEVPISQISLQLKRMISHHKDDRIKLDGQVAEFLHRLLPLTRREAAEIRFWHYLAIVECPFYVAWRYFDERESKTNRERYLGPLDRNAFSRLWWWAELTADRNIEDYRKTLRGAESAEFVKGTVENLLGGNKDVLDSLIDLLFVENANPTEFLINRMFMKVNALLVTVAVDALSKEDVHRLIRRVYEHELNSQNQ